MEILKYSLNNPSIEYFSTVLFFYRHVLFYSKHFKIHFLIDHNYEARSETFDGVAFVRIFLMFLQGDTESTR